MKSKRNRYWFRSFEELLALLDCDAKIQSRMLWLSVAIAVVGLFAIGFIWWRIFRAVIPYHNTGEFHNYRDLI